MDTLGPIPLIYRGRPIALRAHLNMSVELRRSERFIDYFALKQRSRATFHTLRTQVQTPLSRCLIETVSDLDLVAAGP